MSSRRATGTTALDALRTHLDESAAQCPKCGHVGGGWQAATTGARVHYRYVCPSCDAIATRTLRLD